MNNSEYGLFQDIIENDEIALDLMFKKSLISDLIQVRKTFPFLNYESCTYWYL